MIRTYDHANIQALNMGKEKPYYRQSNMSLEIIKAFLQKGANFGEFYGKENVPVFHNFVGRPEVLDLLLKENKIDINAKRTDCGSTIFHAAAYNGNVDLMEFLIKNKANINAKNNQGQTPLSIAKQYHQELVCWLIDNGANWTPN